MPRSIERLLSRRPQPPPTPSTLPLTGFRADVQALRGVAVLAVVLYHAQVLLPGGYVGVDVFFVISGFVIGRTLLAEFLTDGRVSFPRFYARRARRLLPALGALLVTVVLVTPLIGPLGAQDVTPATARAAALFHANFQLYGATEEGYFTAAAELNPLLHTWSLSVEEQFYFALPVVMVLLWRLGRGTRARVIALRVGIAVIAGVSLAASLVASYVETDLLVDGLQFAFFSPFTRAWQFAVGLALVVLPLRTVAPPAVRRVAVAGGGVGLAVAFLAFDEGTVFPGVAALLPTLATAAIIYGGTTTDGAQAARRGSLGPLIWLGDLSYSWYLWHWPFIVFARALAPEAGWPPLVLAAALSLAPAWVSFHLLERRLRLRPTSSRRRTALVAAACIALPVLAATAAAPQVREVANDRLVLDDFNEARLRHAGSTPECDDPTPLAERDPASCLWDFTDPEEAADDPSGSVLLLGDSNAGHFSEAFIDAAEDLGWSVRITTLSACRVALPADPTRDGRSTRCRDFVEGTLEAIERDPPALVVLANATDHTVFPDELERMAVIREGEGDPVGAVTYVADYIRVVERIQRAGSQVAVLATVPKATGWDGRDCSAWLIHVAQDRCLPGAVDAQNRVVTVANQLEEQVADATGALWWSLNDALCPQARCLARVDGAWQWRDGGHLSVQAARRLGPTVSALIGGSGPRMAPDA